MAAGPVTVDASVFLNAFLRREAGHAESRACLAGLRRDGTPIAVPTLLLPEVSGTIARVTGEQALAARYAALLARLPHLTLTPLDARLGRRAAEIAARFRLRGSDAVYGVVAEQYAAALVTLDREQAERLAPLVVVRSPAELGRG